MPFKKFITETKSEITSNELFSLRMLYQPIVGSETISLYQFFLDEHIISNGDRMLKSFKAIFQVLNIDSLTFEKSLKKLEAIGLIRTFEKADNKTFVFKINNPLLPDKIKNNKILYNQIIKKIGDTEFERISFFLTPKKIDKSEFKETTTKFDDIFNFSLDKNQINNTMEINIDKVKYTNNDEAMKGLNPNQYIYFLTNKRSTPTQMAMIDRLKKHGISNHSINAIISYAFKKNNKIVSNYIEKIATDYINKNIIDPLIIIDELSFIEESSTSSLNKFTNQEILNVSNDTSTTEDNWDDIFKSLGGKF